jgi:hypothetical protein
MLVDWDSGEGIGVSTPGSHRFTQTHQQSGWDGVRADELGSVFLWRAAICDVGKFGRRSCSMGHGGRWARRSHRGMDLSHEERH